MLFSRNNEIPRNARSETAEGRPPACSSKLTAVREPPANRDLRPQASGLRSPTRDPFVLAQLGDEGKVSVAHSALVQRLLELGLAGEHDLSCGRGLYEGGQVFSLRRREACSVEVLLPLEEPDPPRERDEDAAWLWAGDLAFSPVYVERGILVHVPEGLLEAHSVFAAGEGRVLHPLIREALDPLVDPTLPRRVLPETREIQPPLPVEVPVDDACRIEVVHRGHELAGVSDPELPAAPQVWGALERPVIPTFGELGDLARDAGILADPEVFLFRVVGVTQRVSEGHSAVYDRLPEDTTVGGAIHPRREGLARIRSDVVYSVPPGAGIRQRAAPSSPHGRGRL